MLLSSQGFTRIMLIFFIGIYIVLFINKSSADETRMQKISNFSIDINEVTIGDFYRFVTSTNYKTKAERRGWGYVYEFGWAQKRGWNWKNPYGIKGEEDEPAAGRRGDVRRRLRTVRREAGGRARVQEQGGEPEEGEVVRRE